MHDTGEARSVSVALQMVVTDDEGWTHQVDISGTPPSIGSSNGIRRSGTVRRTAGGSLTRRLRMLSVASAGSVPF